MTARQTSMPTLQTITVGRHCAGFILKRSASTFEAFDYAERSLGIFNTANAAANAVADELTDDAGL
jgi:hypothetical protein